MGAIPQNLAPDAGPPMWIPLRHLLIGLGFLVIAVVVALATELRVLADPGSIVFVHTYLVGWICMTIMGALTQFVPVWSGRSLHSNRLAEWQLWFVVGGLLLYGIAWIVTNWWLLVIAGCSILLGLWILVYNIGRSLLSARPWDVTERHFAIAVSYFFVLSLLGIILAASLAEPAVLDVLPIAYASVRSAHVTIAVFGAVLITIYGAIYQLAPMFTQAKPARLDNWLRVTEEGSVPIGVALLGAGRLFTAESLALVGGGLVIIGTGAVGLFVARQLIHARVAWTPMLYRYAFVVVWIAIWVIGTLPGWLTQPLGFDVRFGVPGSFTVIAIGVIGFVAFGTLYHVIPFIVWIHRYSDDLGLREVPMIDDLYDGRIARIDGVCLGIGTIGLVFSDIWLIWDVLRVVSISFLAGGVGLFVLNMTLVVHRHSPHSFGQLLFHRRHV